MQNNYNELLNFVENRILIQRQFYESYQKQLAIKFNTLNFIDLNENKISELFAYFLNPRKEHGHGDEFFKLFISHLGILFEYDNPNEIKVQLEYPTIEKRRIDILITQNEFQKAIAIENKIYSGTADQMNQLSDYIDFLDKKTKGHFCLFYLVPRGKEPSIDSISTEKRQKYEASDQFRVIHYEDHIIPLLKKFRGVTENDRVRSFLFDFESKLNQWYIGNNINNMEDIKNHIRNQNKLEASFSIQSALNSIKIDLKKEFENSLNDLAGELHLLKESSLKYQLPNWKNHFIIFNYESGGLIYGIMRKIPDPQKSGLEEIENLFHGQENFRSSAVWPLYAYFYSNIEASPDFWIDIESGVAIKRAKEFIMKIIDADLSHLSL